MIDPTLINQLIAAVIALITALLAIYETWKNKQTVAFYTEPKAVISPRIEAKLPARSYLMDEGTRRWVKAGESDEDQRRIDEQINNAERDGLRTYYIDTSQGWYLIEYGLIKGGAKGDAPKPSG